MNKITQEDFIIESDLLNIQGAESYLNLNISTIRYLVFTRKIPHLKVGKRILFSKDTLDQWLKSKERTSV